MTDGIYDKIANGIEISADDIVSLLSVSTFSAEYYDLLRRSNERSKNRYGSRGYIFAQIGLNAEPCSVNCKFCSMGKSHYSIGERYVKTMSQIAAQIRQIREHGSVSDLFMMTTADYSKSKFLEIGRVVRGLIPDNMRLVANIGDFDAEYAAELRKAGFTGVYHIVRLGEGVDTEVNPQRRVQTIDSVIAAGLELYYCVEPIGPEHSYAQIADEIIRARKLGISAMAVMRRCAVEGTPLENMGEISIPELCKIAAVAALVVDPSRSMNVHETTELSLAAGVNQLYAEIGANPRDTVWSTELSRGLTAGALVRLFENYGIEINQ